MSSATARSIILLLLLVSCQLPGTCAFVVSPATVLLPLVATIELKSQLRRQQQQQQPPLREYDDASPALLSDPLAAPNVDELHARAGVLRRSILQQQLELQQLERQILCCSSHSTQGNRHVLLAPPRMWNTFQASTRALLHRLGTIHEQATRLQQQRDKKNHNNRGSKIPMATTTATATLPPLSSRRVRQWESLADFVATQTTTGLRIVDGLLHNVTQIQYVVGDPDAPTLVPHVPLLLSRLDRLESHVGPILERVLNNQRHLRSIEPYLPQVLERLDDIEPHFPWILNHIDVLAPYTGLLLKHIDELLLYADVDDHEDAAGNGDRYAFAEQLLPYLEFYVSRLDTVGPHLPLLRPHIPKLLKYNRIAKMTPYMDRLFALGYKDNLGASANLDVLLFWFGWALRVPGLPRLFFAIPGSSHIVTFLANRLPKRFVRGECAGISCTVDNDYGGRWNQLSPLPPSWSRTW